MSINKHNIKRRTMIVAALTMIVAVLAAGTAHAGTRGVCRLPDQLAEQYHRGSRR